MNEELKEAVQNFTEIMNQLDGYGWWEKDDIGYVWCQTATHSDMMEDAALRLISILKEMET